MFINGSTSTGCARSSGDLTAIDDRLRLAAYVSDIGWWNVEAGDGHLSWSQCVRDLFSIPAGQPVMMADFYGGLESDDREQLIAAYLAAADPERRMPYDVEYRIKGRSDGVIRWIAAKGRGIFDQAGRCTREIGTVFEFPVRCSCATKPRKRCARSPNCANSLSRSYSMASSVRLPPCHVRPGSFCAIPNEPGR